MIITGELLEQIGFKKTEGQSFFPSKGLTISYSLGTSEYIVLDEYDETYGWRLRTNHSNYSAPTRIKTMVELLRKTKEDAYQAGVEATRDGMISCLGLSDFVHKICRERESYN